MENIDTQYDLDDSDRVVLAKEVAALESSEAAFEDYKKKLEVILKHKSKAYKEEQQAAFQAKVEEELEKRLAELSTEASVKEDATVEELVESVEASEDPAIVNNNEASSKEESLRDKFMKAFNPETISVTY